MWDVRPGVMAALAYCLLLLLLPLTQVDGGTEAEIIKALEETQKEVAWKYIPLSGPSFDKPNSRNVTAQLGKTAVLNCRIKYLGGKTVSWLRSRDLHLLTVGRFTYTSDERFKSLHRPGSEDWLLKIHYTQHRDAGAYECQISTTPPISSAVWLTVVEPETRVLGGPDLYINSGSTINLTCVVKHSPQPPPYIFWYHENKLLSYDSPRGGITVVTEHGPISTSRLLIQRATRSDAGRYTCKPANSDPHHLTVHIIHNEHPAAIHHKNGTSSSTSLHRPHVSISLPLILPFILLVSSLLTLSSTCGLPVEGCDAGADGKKMEQEDEVFKHNSFLSYLLCSTHAHAHAHHHIINNVGHLGSRVNKTSSFINETPSMEEFSYIK